MAYEQSLIDSLKEADSYTADKRIAVITQVLEMHLNEHSNKEMKRKTYEVYSDKEVVESLKNAGKEYNRLMSILGNKIKEVDDLIGNLKQARTRNNQSPIEKTIEKLGEQEWKNKQSLKSGVSPRVRTMEYQQPL